MTDPLPDDRSRVRRGRPADLPALRRLQSALREPSPQLLGHALAPGGGAGASVFVSTAADRPVGYLLAVDGEDVHVAELVVAPDHRRQGRADELLGTLLAAVADGRRITLLVAPDNAPALSLYRSRGFERAGRREAFYDGEPALLLARCV